MTLTTWDNIKVRAPKYSVLLTFANLLTTLCNCLLTSQAKAMQN